MEKRKSNIELLRIISMIMITLHHFSLYLGLYSNNSLGIQKNILGVFLFSLGKIGVNIFVIIGGYFLINSTFNVKKIVKLWLEIFFYSLSILIIGKIFRIQEFSMNESMKSIFPISFQRYWFASSYIYLLILTPILNFTIKKLSRNQHKNIIIIGTILFSLIYSTLYGSIGFGGGTDAIGILPWFILLYFIASYIKIYDIKIKNIKLKTLITFITFELFICIPKLLIEDNQTSNNFIYYYTRMNSIFVLLISIEIFLIFKNMEIKTSNIINNIAKVSFPVYLIQEHHMLKNLWPLVINPFENIEILLVSAIIIVLGLFIVAIIIEKIRQVIFEKINDDISNKIEKIVLKNLDIEN